MGLWSGAEKNWEKARYFFQFPDLKEFMERAVEALDDQKDWHGQENLLLSSRLVDTWQVEGHVKSPCL